jgi:CRISPR-associated protein (TIGR03986 family)
MAPPPIFTAPYDFVPLSGFVWLPEWSRQASHDLPFRDGWCGELQVEIVADSPILVGGGDEARRKREDKATEVSFFETRDAEGNRRFAIPGSSLRGMLRNVVEIACYGRMALVDDTHLGVRDITKGVKFYQNRMVGTNSDDLGVPNARAGWLRPDAKGGWELIPCEYARVDGRVLQGRLETDMSHQAARSTLETWWWSKEAKDYLKIQRLFERHRLCLIGAEPTIVKGQARGGSGEYGRAEIGSLLPFRRRDEDHGGWIGHLVITGPVMRKQREFVFFGADGQSPAREVPQRVMKGFRAVNELGDEEGGEATPWAYWSKRLAGGLCGPKAKDSFAEPGIPVFWLENKEGQIAAIGLSMMFRLPYDRTVGETIADTSKMHREAPAGGFDMAELLFGAARPDGKESLKGRVSVGLALADAGVSAQDPTCPLILNSPKPGFYPAYIRQDFPNAAVNRVAEIREPGKTPRWDYRSYMHDEHPRPAEIKGWKRYPPHQGAPSPSAAAATQDQMKLASILHTLPAGTRFTATLRVHNLRLAELGALLWTLRFGDPDLGADAAPRDPSHPGPAAPALFHGLGMGKPLGFGRVWLRLRGARLRPNDTEQGAGVELDQGAAMPRLFKEAMAAFEAAADAALRANSQGAPEPPGAGEGWRDSEVVRRLLDAARPRGGQRHMRLSLEGTAENAFKLAKEKGLALPVRPLEPAPWADQTRFPRKAQEAGPPQIVSPELPQGPASLPARR